MRKHRFLKYEEKYLGLKYYFENGLKLAELSRELRVGESTVRDWLKKIEYDFNNIERLKRKRVTVDERCHKNKQIFEFSDEIKKIIDELLGNDPSMGALKIKQYFYRHNQLLLSEKQIYFYLKEQGIIEKRKKKEIEKQTHDRSFEYPKPLSAIQLDLMQMVLSGGTKVYLISFLDDYSRYILNGTIIPVKTMEEVIKALKNVIREYGIPERILTDKGSEFVSWQSFTKFEDILCTFDIELIASGPDKPQNQGKIERWHQTLKKGLNYSYGCFSYPIEAQNEVNRFMNYYNYERPHQGIGGLVPADRFHGLEDDITQELSKYKNKKYNSECIYFSGNINGQKFVISGSRGSEIKIIKINHREKISDEA